MMNNDTLYRWMIGIVIAIGTFLLLLYIKQTFEHKIVEGTIVNKLYEPPREVITTYIAHDPILDMSVPHLTTEHKPAQYCFIISETLKAKHGIKLRTIPVTECVYNSYELGDYYKRTPCINVNNVNNKNN